MKAIYLHPFSCFQRHFHSRLPQTSPTKFNTAGFFQVGLGNHQLQRDGRSE